MNETILIMKNFMLYTRHTGIELYERHVYKDTEIDDIKVQL